MFSHRLTLSRLFAFNLTVSPTHMHKSIFDTDFILGCPDPDAKFEMMV